MNILYLVTARGGSKGLPGKNTRPLGGKPLVAWTIEAAVSSKCKGETVISTDSEEIAQAAVKYGASAPFVRPAHLATDTASSIDVVMHALETLEAGGKKFTHVMLLQPTSPLRTVEDIEGAIRTLQEKDAAAVVSVCPAEHHPLWANTLPPGGCMKDFIREEIKGKNRQQLPEYYRLNGALYLSEVNYLGQKRTFIGSETYAYIMPAERSVDIDTELDFKLAELLFEQRMEK